MRSYGTESAAAESSTIEVGIAEYAVTDNGDELSTFGLGSCVAIALYDVENGISGLAHVMLPTSDAAKGEDPGKFVDTAVATMLSEMEARGAVPAHVRAKVVGGSEMFDFSGIAEGVGERNVEATRRELRSLGIPIDAEDVGGDYGRSVRLDGETGDLVMKTADEGEVVL